jgi:hypothetical protein
MSGKLQLRRTCDEAKHAKDFDNHTGSLPRPPELLPLLRSKDGGEPVDRSVFESTVKSAVAEVVRKQEAVGLDVVNDGEMGKISYAPTSRIA